MARIFLSFASEDTDFVLRVFNRLKKLNIDVWDYTNRDEEIPVGNKIPEVLAKKIIESDYFIPIITSNSVSNLKPIVHFEVEFALNNRKKIIPFVIRDRAPATWEGAFEELSDRRYLEFDFKNEKDFENKIFSFCRDINIEYKPLVEDPYKLPLFNKLEKEIDSLLPTFEELKKRSKYEEMMNLVQLFNLSYSLGELEKALQHITYLISFIRYQTGATDIYYPVIVKGSCELTLVQLNNAEKTFTEAAKMKGADENAEGGLGHVYFKQKKYKDAFHAYKKALAKCTPQHDLEIQYNLLLTAIELLNDENENNSDECFTREVYEIINTSDNWCRELKDIAPNDQVKINYVRAMAFTKVNDYDNALEAFDDIFKPVTSFSYSIVEELNQGNVSATLHQFLAEKMVAIPYKQPINSFINEKVTKSWFISENESIYIFKIENNSVSLYYTEAAMLLDYSDLLVSLGNAHGARDLLVEYVAYTNDRSFYQRLALLHSKLNNIDAAKEIYENKLCIPPFNRQLLVEYALILRKLGLHSKMKKICTEVISLGNPKEPDEWYYHGFAFYLQGQSTEARFYYNGCGSSFNYYSNLT
ncbi:MAG: TIR domain-containing protein [Bacteroidota bacterium]